LAIAHLQDLFCKGEYDRMSFQVTTAKANAAAA
jgi:hypothetical protein